jgi:hypothetical protein
MGIFMEFMGHGNWESVSVSENEEQKYWELESVLKFILWTGYQYWYQIKIRILFRYLNLTKISTSMPFS